MCIIRHQCHRCVFLSVAICACVRHDYTLGSTPVLNPLGGSRCSTISSPVARYVSMSPSVTGRECQLDVLVTKLSILSDGQIRLVEMGAGPCKRKPDVPQIHTNMQINIKINITLANEPSITGQFLSSSALARQHQSATPSNGVIEHHPLIPLTPQL